MLDGPVRGAHGRIVRTFRPGDVDGLLAAIEDGRRSDPDPVAAGALAAPSTWAAAFAAETAQLTRLVARVRDGSRS